MTIGHMLEPPLRGPRGEPGLERLTDAQLLGMFVESADESAFAAIVVRHSPRVLGVCRQVLRRSQDVEDTFQATFLLLARKAATIRERSSLGHWLHGVAHRLAVRTKVKTSRRDEVAVGRQGEAMEARSAEHEIDRGELQRIVHEEIDRLPERLRLPILLCYLEGLTNEGAARRLGCSPSALKERLAKARSILSGRLSRRGLALSAALFVLLIPRTSPAADVPRRLVESTVVAVMARVSRGRRSIAATTADRGLKAPSPPRRAFLRLSFLALAGVAVGLVAVGVLYLASPDRSDFLSWIRSAIRRACH